ncbi:hypothetical protein SNE40_021476 [Patella caerulea]|uniref:L-Fucosyltransferase n=1 Tax=Patella caerulea TaxID=87958 RepID=A0AAN8J4A3_PATCE
MLVLLVLVLVYHIIIRNGEPINLRNIHEFSREIKQDELQNKVLKKENLLKGVKPIMSANNNIINVKSNVNDVKTIVGVVKTIVNDVPTHVNDSKINVKDVKTRVIDAKTNMNNVQTKAKPQKSNFNIDPPQKYICAIPEGRLGNEMYIFASAYGTARRHGVKLIMNNVAHLKEAFNIDGAYETDWEKCAKVPVIHEEACCRVSKNIFNVSADPTVLVRGYMQSYKYFYQYRAEVRKYLTFKDSVLDEAKDKLRKLLSQRYQGHVVDKRTFIGVHVRRGDYLNAPKIKYGYKVAPKEYLYSAQEYMQKKYSNITYVVCSNDLAWTNKVFKNQHDVITVPMGPAHVDLALLSLMDHMIMTVGTYGFWASWMANGTVTYYKDFTSPGSEFSKGFDKGYLDTFPESWIGL